jgi:RNA polymerase sigma-70 factor (ECF subfamily)
MSEQEIVEAAKTDIAAFGQLYNKYFDKIYNYIFAMLHDHQASEDVVSLAFEKALNAISTYEDRGFSFGAWLYRIARNCALDYIDQQKKLTHFDSEEVLISDTQNTENTADELIRKEELWAAIMKLEEHYREVVILRYIDGYSIIETVNITGKTEDAIKSICKRALKILKDHLYE